MATIDAKDNKTRKQIGSIKFPNRSYPIYEGLNMIGRDPKATVRIKDLTFSKQHAVITAVNENLHFVSDFGSSNGTQVKDIICVPFKLYEIQDWDTIIFGDIVGIYHTGIDENSNEQHETDTQFNDTTIPATQLLTQNIYNKETQPIHDADTQPTTHNQQDNIEQPVILLNTCENDLLLSKSELYDDIFANETFRSSFETTGSKFNIEVDETLPTDSKNNADNSIDSDDIILSTQDNVMIDKQALEVIQNSENKTQPIENSENKTQPMQNSENKTQPFQNSENKTQSIKKECDDDSATDIEDEEEFVKKIQEQSTQFNTSKTHNSSDSETDVDDDLILKNPIANIKTEIINKENIDHSDDEIDLMGPTEKLITETDYDDDLLLVPTQILDNKNNSQDSEIDLMAPTQILEKDYIHDVPTQLIQNGDRIHDAPTQLIENNKKNSKKDLQKDFDDDAPTQILQKRRDEYMEKQPNDDDDLAPTQLLQSNKKQINNDDDAPTQLLQNDEKQVNIDGADDEPTQILSKTREENMEKQSNLLQQKNPDPSNDDLVPTQLLQNPEDSIFSAPTQLLLKTPLKKDDAPTHILSKTREENMEKQPNINDDDDDDDLAPTQLLQSGKKQTNINDEDDAPTHILSKTREENMGKQPNIQDDDDDLAPTQLLQSDKKQININDEDDAPTQILSKTREENIGKQPNMQDDDDEDLAPTQLLQPIPNNVNIKKDELPPAQLRQPKNVDVCIDDDDDDLAPTQLLTTSKVPKDDDTGNNLAPTHLLQQKNPDPSDDDLPPTQLLQNPEDSIFSAPTQLLLKSPLKKSILGTNSPKKKKVVNFSEDVIFDLPTQILSDDQNIQVQIIEKKENNTLKSDMSNDTSTKLNIEMVIKVENELNITQESDTSLKLVLSDESFVEKPEESDTQAETQLEVNFDLETQKIYVEEHTRRPNNPLANMFDEEPTQNTEELPKNEEESTVNTRKDIGHIENNRRLEIRLQNIKDLEEASTSTIEVPKKKGRPKKSVDKVAENAPKLNVTKVKIDKKKDEVPPEEKRSTRGKRISYQLLNNGQIELKCRQKKDEKPLKKDVEEENEDDDFQPESPKKKQLEIEDVKRSARQNRTLKVSLDKIEDTNKQNVAETPKKTAKINEEPEIKRQNRTLKVSLDKIEDPNKQNVAETPKKKAEINEEPEIKRYSRRILKTPVLELENDNSNDFVSKNKITNTVPESPKNSKLQETRSSRRLPKTSSNEDKRDDNNPTNKRTMDDNKKENISEERRTSRRQTRTPAKLDNKHELKRGRRVHIETPKKDEINIEDSSDSDNFPVKKKVIKLEFTQESDNSEPSQVLKEKPKRVMKIEEYSSDEDRANSSLHSNTKRRKFEPLNVTLTSTQENQVTHKIVFTMLNDTSLESTVKKLGGSVIDSAKNCTVLVTNKISRSLKFLVAVALGKPIVNANWIKDSAKKNYFLDPWHYLLVDKESEAKFNFSLESSLKKSTQKKLLTDLSFLIAAQKNCDVLKEIIETSGGKIITRAPGKTGKAFVVSYEEEKAKYSKYLKQTNLTVVSAEAIFSGVLQQEFHCEKYLLN